MVALFILVGALTGASSASANATTTQVAPIITVESASVGSFEFNLSGTVLEDVKMSYKGTNYKKCKWVKGGYNSGRGIDGRLYWFWDPVKAYICRSKKSPTGWIKMKGGKTGRKCGNPWKQGKPKGPIVKNVTLIKSFTKFKITVSAVATAKVTGVCPNNPGISGEATASGNVSAVITMATLVKAKGSAARTRVEIQMELRGQGVANATTRLNLNCGSPPPPPCEETGTCPPPPNRPPVVSIYNPPQHVCSGQLVGGGTTTPGQIVLVIFASDPDGDNLGTPTVSALRGTTGVPTKVDDGQWTVRYTAPVSAGYDIVTVTVSDGKANPVSASTPQFANPLVDLDNPSTTTC